MVWSCKYCLTCVFIADSSYSQQACIEAIASSSSNILYMINSSLMIQKQIATIIPNNNCLTDFDLIKASFLTQEIISAYVALVIP